MSNDRTLSRAAPIAPFIAKLFDLLSRPESWPFIRWNEAGDSVIILEPDGLMVEILPRYFKHTKLCSFVRQLNMYGFEKLTDRWEFRHQDGLFRRDSPELLEKIFRRASSKKARAHDEIEDDDIPKHQDQRFKADPVFTPAGGEIQPIFDLKSYEERQATQESVLHYLLETVHTQRQELQQLRSQVSLLTNFVLSSPAAAQLAPPPLPTLPSPQIPAALPLTSVQQAPSPRFGSTSSTPPPSSPSTVARSSTGPALPASPPPASPFARHQHVSAAPHMKESPTSADDIFSHYPSQTPAFLEDSYGIPRSAAEMMEWTL